MNLDATEIQKFNELARHFWDPTGPMQGLHRINPSELTGSNSSFQINRWPAKRYWISVAAEA